SSSTNQNCYSTHSGHQTLFWDMLLLVWFSGALADNCGGLTPALRITTPNIMEALTGSCLQIPCTYEPEVPEYDSSKTIYGVWLKGGVNFGDNPSLVIFNSSGSINKYSPNITGNLKEKNCTTLFPDLQTSHAEKYYFRVEKGDYKGTACADPLQIKVKVCGILMFTFTLLLCSFLSQTDSLIKIKTNDPLPLSVSVGGVCPQEQKRFPSKFPSESYFTLQLQIDLNSIYNRRGREEMCKKNHFQFICRLNLLKRDKVLYVKFKPGQFDRQHNRSGLVSAGSWVELSCSSRAKPPPRFTWFRNGIKVSEIQNYNFIVTEEGEFYCVAKNDLGNETS
uniref:Ig-like domain-containing protein n=1 Tax=Poecilia formosa TaxID=48698 RepID=A0A096MGM5_POEFO